MANKKVSQLTSKPSVLTTDLFPIADPSTGQLFKTTISDLGTAIGSGVSSVNSLVGAVVLDTDDIQELVSPTNKWFTDTRARAALSASSPLTYNSVTGAFGIQVANGSQNGYLSSTDWTTFNAKQAALSGTGFVKISGTTISYDNSTYLTTSAAASTYLALGGGTMTGALIGTSAGFTGYVGIGNTSPLYQLDVTGSGRFEGDLHILSSNPRIYLTDSDNNPDYFISNTDGTFTVYDVTNSASRLTISSSQIQPRLPIVSNSTIQGTAFYSDSFFSATTFVQATTFMASPSYRLTGGTSPTGLYFGHTDKVVLANYTVGGGIDFETNGGNITMQLSSGGVLSTTGGASFSGALSGTSATFTNSLHLDRTGVTAATPLRFTTAGTNDWFIGQSPLGTSTSDLFFYSYGTSSSVFTLAKSTGAATFSSSVTAGQMSIGTTSTSSLLNINGTGYWPTKLITLSGAEPTRYSGNMGLNIVGGSTIAMSFGTRNNNVDYDNTLNIINGNVGIGTTAPTSLLDVKSSTPSISINSTNTSNASTLLFKYSDSYVAEINAVAGSGQMNFNVGPSAGWGGYMSFKTDTSERMRITSSGNVGIGTTSPGVSLEVNGLIRSLPTYNNTTANLPNLVVSAGGTFERSTTSSKRHKENITLWNGKGLNTILALQPKEFTYKSDYYNYPDRKFLGLIAEEVAEVSNYLADFANEDGTGQVENVRYANIVVPLIKAVQELKAELDTLKNK